MYSGKRPPAGPVW